MTRKRPTMVDLLARIDALEARVNQLESRPAPAAVKPSTTPPAREEIPWTVITAAVAAMLPDASRILSVRLLSHNRLNWWGVEGRIEHFNSHRLR